METVNVFKTNSKSLTQESSFIEQNRNSSYQNFISTSSYLREKHVDDLKDYFESLRNLWFEETKYSSNIFLTANHPANLTLVKLGYQIIPFIIEDLKNNSSHWFITLSQITGINPIKSENRGNIEQMKNDWIEWAKENNYI